MYSDYAFDCGQSFFSLGSRQLMLDCQLNDLNSNCFYAFSSFLGHTTKGIWLNKKARRRKNVNKTFEKKSIERQENDVCCRSNRTMSYLLFLKTLQRAAVNQ